MTITSGQQGLVWLPAGTYRPATGLLLTSRSTAVQGYCGTQCVYPSAEGLWLPVHVLLEAATGAMGRYRVEGDIGELIPVTGSDLQMTFAAEPLRDGAQAIAWPAAAGGDVTITPIVNRWTSDARARWTCTRYLAPPTAGPGGVLGECPVPPYARRFRLFTSPTTNPWSTTPFSLYGSSNRYMAQYPYREIQAAMEGEWLDLPHGVQSLYTVGAPASGGVPPTVNDVLAVQFQCEVTR